MRRSLLLLSLSAVVAVLAGCGSKGPLVLPPATSPAVPASTAPSVAPVSAAPAGAASSASPAASEP